jgi:hypothetical protein
MDFWQNFGKNLLKIKRGYSPKAINPLISLVRPAGFEPAAYGFVVRRSVRAELRALKNFIEMSLPIKL